MDARPLDMLSPDTRKDRTPSSESTRISADCQGPILFVPILANTRGLDFPYLSHVFVMSLPEGRADSYTHIVGRFGEGGKALIVIAKIEEEVNDSNMLTLDTI